MGAASSEIASRLIDRMGPVIEEVDDEVDDAEEQVLHFETGARRTDRAWVLGTNTLICFVSKIRGMSPSKYWRARQAKSTSRPLAPMNATRRLGRKGRGLYYLRTAIAGGRNAAG